MNSNKFILHRKRVSKTTAGGRKSSISVYYLVSNGHNNWKIKKYKSDSNISIMKHVNESEIPVKLNPVLKSLSKDFTFKYKGMIVIGKRAYKSGIVCPNIVKPIIVASGIENITLKFLGSKNPINLIRCTEILLEKSLQYFKNETNINK